MSYRDALFSFPCICFILLFISHPTHLHIQGWNGNDWCKGGIFVNCCCSDWDCWRWVRKDRTVIRGVNNCQEQLLNPSVTTHQHPKLSKEGRGSNTRTKPMPRLYQCRSWQLPLNLCPFFFSFLLPWCFNHFLSQPYQCLLDVTTTVPYAQSWWVVENWAALPAQH